MKKVRNKQAESVLRAVLAAAPTYGDLERYAGVEVRELFWRDKSEAQGRRDWFAGLAMQGGIAGPHEDGTYEQAAETAYRYADAMLAQRAKP